MSWIIIKPSSNTANGWSEVEENNLMTRRPPEREVLLSINPFLGFLKNRDQKLLDMSIFHTLSVRYFIHTSFYFTILLVACACADNKTFYVDSASGDDTDSGNSPSAAWASLEKVNDHLFKPGDKILFKCGTEYQGQLIPKGIGNDENPIVIDMYGNGAKPRIEANGKFDAALKLYNVAYWEINNLMITNTGKERKAGRRGVVVQAENFGDCNHIYLKNLDIHHVNGSLVKSKGGGSAILWQNGGDRIKTRFVDLRIEDCHLYNCGRNGINSRGYTRRDQWHPSINVVVRNNLLERIPGDGIVPIGCDGALIEHNIMRDCPEILPEGEAAAGIWPWSSDHTTIQYNEVSGHNAPWDAQGFDSDWNCRNTVIQYNYSHDNAGGFLLICNNGNNIGTSGNIGTIGTVVRYNLSVNDGYRAEPTKRKGYFSPTFHISGPCKNSRIYNNVIYVPRKKSDEIDKTIVHMDNWGGPWPENTFFANNIFYVEDTADFVWGESRGHIFKNNLYYGAFRSPPSDKSALYGDPQFLKPEVGIHGISSLKGFKLQKDSRGIASGLKVIDERIEDFYGNEVLPDNNPSIGIHEYNGEL
ncbi:MAG: right-handed parallel beta-helix repeat-containing protein [Cytophagales bacterium]|nr:right-handed parallel beta-helix repeat-containing protein [Cytophagales bacterium]